MSMPAAVDRYYTRDEVLVLPDDGNRYELVYGELLVTPSPAVSHQLVVGRLFAALHAYVERHVVGRAFVSPADLSWGREDIIVQPDIFVLSPGDVREDRWERLRHFELFVEVLSPSTARYDRFTKRRLYQEMRVPLYWVIDIGRRRAEVWTPEATMPMYEEERVRWEPAGAGEGIVMELAELFRA